MKVVQAGGSLNSDWVEWLMGWPSGWTRFDPLSVEEFEKWKRATVEGYLWMFDPSDLPEDHEDFRGRVTDERDHRVDRLSSIGDGQVPICFVAAWNLLTSE